MKKFTTVTSIATHLPLANLNTDVIIPQQYLKTIKRSGLGKFLFEPLRDDFTLKQTQILLTGDNFGCGSSREHAVWSLLDFGIQVVIAPSFGDIFYNNASKNGLLLIRLPQEEITELATVSTPLSIDLQNQTITCAGKSKKFQIENHLRITLLEGLDEITETLKYEAEITAFEQKNQQ